MGHMMQSIDTCINGLFLTNLKIIDVPGGEVLHAMKRSDQGYSGFGEAYFSRVQSGVIKAWKKHNLMTLNLVVCLGEVKFVVYDDRPNSVSKGAYYDVILSQKNYFRLTVPPLVWMGFQGVSKKTSMLLNMIDIEHCSEELDRKDITEINYDWRVGLSK
jgi:dTDP-4-dehydrorhamnose 3,5-epimerase